MDHYRPTQQPSVNLMFVLLSTAPLEIHLARGQLPAFSTFPAHPPMAVSPVLPTVPTLYSLLPSPRETFILCSAKAVHGYKTLRGYSGCVFWSCVRCFRLAKLHAPTIGSCLFVRGLFVVVRVFSAGEDTSIVTKKWVYVIK